MFKPAAVLQSLVEVPQLQHFTTCSRTGQGEVEWAMFITPV